MWRRKRPGVALKSCGGEVNWKGALYRSGSGAIGGDVEEATAAEAWPMRVVPQTGEGRGLSYEWRLVLEWDNTNFGSAASASRWLTDILPSNGTVMVEVSEWGSR